ncbi:hypothetical protein [Sorangium sp. So ce1182]|uniref:hypothetical protein n=1 Tax=Sorangium sp. So ce1182 TaxID=3133334 RepID=UPI003F6073F6
MIPPTDSVIYAELERRGCAAELRVNGLPVAYLARAAGVFGTRAAHEYLVPGKNRIALSIEPGPKPSLADAQHRESMPAGAVATGRLVLYPAGVFIEPENGEVLAQLEWQSGGEEETFPRVLEAEVDLGAFLGGWSWQDAPELALDDALVAEARAVLARVAAAIRAGDLGAFWAATEVRIREAIRAYPALDEEAARAELGDFLALYRQNAADPVFPLREERHDFRLLAGGRVLQCVDDDFQPSLRLRDPEDGSPVPYAILRARINGRIEVVR